MIARPAMALKTYYGRAIPPVGVIIAQLKDFAVSNWEYDEKYPSHKIFASRAKRFEKAVELCEAGAVNPVWKGNMLMLQSVSMPFQIGYVVSEAVCSCPFMAHREVNNIAKDGLPLVHCWHIAIAQAILAVYRVAKE